MKGSRERRAGAAPAPRPCPRRTARGRAGGGRVPRCCSSDMSRCKRVVVSWAVAALLISCGAENESEQAHTSSPFPDSLVGAWVRVYPSPGGRDTLLLNPDGSAHGPLHRLGQPLERASRWRVGFFSTSDLCLGDDHDLACQGYVLRGDTLALANLQQTVLIRAQAFARARRRGDSLGTVDRALFGDTPPATKAGRRIP